MCVLIFCTTFVWNISHSKKNWARCDQTCILVFMWNTRYSCQIIMKIKFSQRFSKNTQISKLPESQCSGSRALPCRTDGQIDLTKLVVGFRNFANASKNVLLVLKHCLQCIRLCGSTGDTSRFPNAGTVCCCWTGSHVHPLQLWQNSGMILIGFSWLRMTSIGDRSWTFGSCVSCTVVVLTCFVMCGCVWVWVLYCVGVCECGFYIVWVCVSVGCVMCGCV